MFQNKRPHFTVIQNNVGENYLLGLNTLEMKSDFFPDRTITNNYEIYSTFYHRICRYYRACICFHSTRALKMLQNYRNISELLNVSVVKAMNWPSAKKLG